MKISHSIAEQIFFCLSRMKVTTSSTRLAVDIIRICKPSAPHMLLSEKERKDVSSSTSKGISFDWVEAIGRFVRSASTETELNTSGNLAASNGMGILSLLKDLPKETVALFAGMVTHTFVNDLVESNDTSASLQRLRAWVEALDKVHELHWTTGLTGGRLDEIVKAMATVVWPSDIPFVFEKLHGRSMCTLLREYWLPRLDKVQPLPLENENFPYTKTNATKSEQLDTDTVEGTATSRFDFHFEKCAAQLESISGEWYNPRQIMLVSLVHATYLSDLNWQHLLLELLKILKLQNRHRDFDCLVRGWKRLTRVTLFTQAHRKVISDYINSRRAPDAHMEMRLLQQDESLYLGDHPRLLSDCLNSDSVRALDIIRLLLRNDPQAILPLGQLNSACILTPDRISLIHDTALAIATSARFSCRESCSSVYLLWRLLRYHCAPLDDRLAQAIIVSNLLKPIAANEWIPVEQLDWAFGVIGDMHGEDAVKELHDKVWPLRDKKAYQMLPYGLQGKEGEALWERHGRKDVDWSLLSSVDSSHEDFVGPKWMSVKARRLEDLRLGRERRAEDGEGMGAKNRRGGQGVVRRVGGEGLTPSQYAAKHYWHATVPERPTAVDWWRIARENGSKSKRQPCVSGAEAIAGSA